MKKILFLVNHDVVIYNFRYELVEKLINDGHEVYISSPNGERIKLLTDIGCKFIETNISRHGTNPYTDFKLLLTYIKIINTVKPDIVFSYTIKPNIYGGMACALTGTRYAVNITGLGTAVENGGIMQKLTVMLYRIAFCKVQKIFFQNTENMKFFADRKIAQTKYSLLPGSGVNLKKFTYCEYPKGETTEFAFISRIMREKGIEQFLDAAEFIKGKYPNTIFHVCGFCEQEYDTKLRELDKRGIIVYHGMVTDVRGVISNVHCIVHPTYYPEGLSNVLLEASACGRPIITTDRSGCREVIDDGKNGYICKQRDSGDLILQLEKFLMLSWDKRRDMGIYGREKAEREFDRQIVVKKYCDELELINDSRERKEVLNI